MDFTGAYTEHESGASTAAQVIGALIGLVVLAGLVWGGYELVMYFLSDDEVGERDYTMPEGMQYGLNSPQEVNARGRV
jgi:hypothetical protein